MQWLGIDIGGANLKLADGRGYSGSCPFALWRQSDRLPQQLRTLIAQAPPASHLAVTMTGELADCFDTKAEGVGCILKAVQEAADGRHTRIYLATGQMVTPQVAGGRARQVAAANWHALACYASRYSVGGLTLVIDVGSTTTDIIPLLDGQVAAQGHSDVTRLLAHELVYVGVERTPLCAVVDQLPYRGRSCPVANEWFATTRDAFLILNELPEDPASLDTADGTPATKPRSRLRLGRMLCADSAEFNHRDAVSISQAVAVRVVERLATSITRVIDDHGGSAAGVLIAGAGEFLALRALQRLGTEARIVSLSREFGAGVSRCAPAHALAVLAAEGASR